MFRQDAFSGIRLDGQLLDFRPTIESRSGLNVSGRNHRALSAECFSQFSGKRRPRPSRGYSARDEVDLRDTDFAGVWTLAFPPAHELSPDK